MMMTSTTAKAPAVINLKHNAALREILGRRLIHENIVLIDRRTKWGNPYVMGRDGNRGQVIERYRADLWRRIGSGELALTELAALDGMCLACWCAPQPCHGHVLVRAAAWAARKLAAG